MLTFEKVLEIFEDYLAQDMELEVYKSRYGYVCVSFNGSPPDRKSTRLNSSHSV